MMKKNILLTACLAVAGMLSVNAQQSIVALHHEGKVTLYAGGATQAAMDASVKGDTLYLSEGMFGGFDVTHGIVVLGSGENTIVSGDITIKGNTEKKDLGDYVFGGLNMLHNFVINDSVNGFRMSQCQMNDFEVKVQKFVDGAEIFMSYIKGTLKFPTTVSSYSYVYGLDVLNSKIKSINGGGASRGTVNFRNCNINVGSATYPGFYNNTYENCIVNSPHGNPVNYSTFVNCLHNSNTEGYATFFNCWYDINLNVDDNMDCSYSDEELRSKGYIGTDGTVVGITGGGTPYTLELFAPHITEHNMEVDNVNKTLKVTLKMAGEPTR